MINSKLLRALLVLMVSSAMFLVSCTEDDGPADLPVAGFTFAVDSETGGIVTFTNTSENADSYSWDFGDDATSTLENPTKTYTADGTYSVVLTATNGAGDDTSSQDITISLVVDMTDTEAPVITLSGDATVELELGAEYTDAGASANDNVDGDLTSSIVVAGDAVDTDASGTYTITYDVSDAAGNAAEQVTRTVKVRYPSGLLTNGDFEGDSTDPWTVNFGEGNVVPVEKPGTNTFFIVNIETADANQPFLVNLSQVVAIEQGKNYKLSFDANSDVNRSIIAGIGLSGGSFASNTSTVSITTETNRYDLELVASFGEAGVDNRVLFDMAGETGVVVLDNITLIEIESTTPEPTEAPAAPTVAEANVTSLFSDSYTDVTVDTWSAEWDDASQEDIDLNGNTVKKVSFGSAGGFLGVDFSTNSFDATAHTHFHMDYWIADDFSAGQILNPKWSNHAGGAEVNAFEYTNAIGDTQSGTWVSLDVEISDFAAGTGTTRDNLSQFILATGNTLGVVYVDNIYLYTSDGSGGGGDTTPDTNAPVPTAAEANVISLFSDSYTDVAVDTWSATWDDASEEDVDIDGNTVKRITFGNGGGFLGVDFSTNSFDATTFTHFHMDFWITDAFSAGQVLNPKWSNHAGGAEVNALEYTNAISDGQSGTWVSLDIELANFTAINGSAKDNLAQFILAAAATLDEVYVDNIYLYKN